MLDGKDEEEETSTDIQTLIQLVHTNNEGRDGEEN
jgi:hypothetical protein